MGVPEILKKSFEIIFDWKGEHGIHHNDTRYNSDRHNATQYNGTKQNALSIFKSHESAMKLSKLTYDIMVFKIITLSLPTRSINALCITEKGSYKTIMLSVVIQNGVRPTRQSGRQGCEADKAARPTRLPGRQSSQADKAVRPTRQLGMFGGRCFA